MLRHSLHKLKPFLHRITGKIFFRLYLNCLSLKTTTKRSESLALISAIAFSFIGNFFGKRHIGETIVFHSDQDNRIGLGFPQFFLNIANRIGVIGYPVRQKVFEFIRWYDNDTGVYMAVLKVIADVDDVPRKKITPAGHLNLDAYSGQDGFIESEFLDPIYVAGFGLNPIGVFVEFPVDQLADTARSICLLFIENMDLHGKQNLLEFKKDVRQPQPAHLFSRSAIKSDLGYLHG